MELIYDINMTMWILDDWTNSSTISNSYFPETDTKISIKKSFDGIKKPTSTHMNSKKYRYSILSRYSLQYLLQKSSLKKNILFLKKMKLACKTINFIKRKPRSMNVIDFMTQFHRFYRWYKWLFTYSNSTVLWI